MDIHQRFLQKVRSEGGCLLWCGHIDRHGYGVIWWDGKPFKAHRLAYILAYGGVPKRAWVTSTCGNRNCVRADHLAAVPPHGVERTTKPRNPRQRLTADDVLRIRARREEGASTRELATEFGVSERHVYSILSGDRWKARR
jgi:hypothetical protein